MWSCEISYQGVYWLNTGVSVMTDCFDRATEVSKSMSVELFRFRDFWRCVGYLHFLDRRNETDLFARARAPRQSRFRFLNLCQRAQLHAIGARVTVS